MFSFIGLDLMFDDEALTPTPNYIVPDKVILRHGVMEHWNVSKDVDFPYTGEIPAEWMVDTIMDCDFLGSLNAGNLNFIEGQITRIRVKRRKITDFAEDPDSWITLFDIPIDETNDLSFNVFDHFARYGTEYVYALVPVTEQVQGDTVIEVEGGYVESLPVLSQFDGVFITDTSTFYHLFVETDYDTMEMRQSVGVHDTLGRQYPIIVANSRLNYESGSVNGMIVNDEIREIGGKFDRVKMVKNRERLRAFITDKKPKVIKDDNSNIWLVFFVETPNITFKDGVGNSLMNLNAKWVETGDAESGIDLTLNNLIGGGLNNANATTIRND